jgi:hypothetical protein
MSICGMVLRRGLFEVVIPGRFGMEERRMVDLNSKSGAIFSDDGLYRYLLWRNWVSNNQRRLLWVMLNPSTADDEDDDPTVQSCICISKHRGYGGLEIVNLFAYRTPDPDVLYGVVNPIGDENDRYMREAAERAPEIVVAWGAWSEKGIYRHRGQEPLKLLGHPEKLLYCLGTTEHSSPRHPLRVECDTPLQPYRRWV